MTIETIITIIGLILVNAGSIIAFVMKMNQSIAEITSRLTNVENRLNEEIVMTREQLNKMDLKLDEINKMMTNIRIDLETFRHVADEHNHFKDLHIK